MTDERVPTRRVMIMPRDDGAATVTDSRRPIGFALPAVYTEELWETPGAADLVSSADRAPREVAFPRPGQTIARLLEFRPTSAADVASENAVVDAMLADAGETHGDLHWTQTTDYFAVLSGQITLSAEGQQVRLAPGDFAICLGALHGWSCHTSENAQVFAVLVGARDRGIGDSTAFAYAGSETTPDQPTVRRVVLGHDQAGVARILGDHRVAVPARLWETDGPTPSNRVVDDRLVSPMPARQPLGVGHGLVAMEIDSYGPLHLAAEDHLVVGIVLRGQPEVGVDGLAQKSSLSPGDVFISAGFGVTLSASRGKSALAAVVTIPGHR